jgi:NAD(P)-dependent dehydrogenase (short-subunit alcohol dehydrogenase family)
MTGLSGLTAVVTGAGAGLGRATALGLAGEGARVFAVSDQLSELERLEADAAASGLDVTGLTADVSDAPRCGEVVDEILRTADGVDVLINNAGIIVRESVEDTTPAIWDRIMAVNLRGPFLYARALVPSMKARRQGFIVNVSSRAGVFGFATQTAYCASKFGIEGLTRSLALELVDCGVVAVSVTPGYPMRTPMSYTTYTARDREVWKEPEEIAKGLLLLVAGRSPAMTGGRFNLWELAQQGLPPTFDGQTSGLHPPAFDHARGTGE